MTRVKWLRKAKALLRRDIQEHSPLLWRTILVIGPLPKTLLGRTSWRPGYPKSVKITISPRIRSASLALAVLMHELTHVAVPYNEQSHGKAFRKIAYPLGFRTPYSIVQNITPELKARLVEVRKKLGPYPPGTN